MALKDFIQNKKPLQKSQGDSSLRNFLNKSKQSTPVNTFLQSTDSRMNTSTQSTASMIEPSNNVGVSAGDAWRWLGKQLMKSSGSASRTLTGLAEATAQASLGRGNKALQTLKTTVSDVGQILGGKKETSFIDEFRKLPSLSGKNTRLENVVKNQLGITGELLLDPLNFVPANWPQKLLAVTKLAKPVEKISVKIGKTVVSQTIKSVFSNKTGNLEFDSVVSGFRNLKNYREGKSLEQAIKLQKDIQKIAKLKKLNNDEVQKLIVDGLENNAKFLTLPDDIKKEVTTLKNTYKTLIDEAHEVGLDVGVINEYAPHIRTKESFLGKLKAMTNTGAKEFTTGAIEKGRKLTGTLSELEQQGINIFEKNPAIQLAVKGQAYAKAITSKQFSDAVKKFAIPTGVKVSNPFLKDLKFAPEMARVIDNYYTAIKPEELKVIAQAFDSVQNLWKAQALVSPSYHIRNVMGNFWNNFLAGVGPQHYIQASAIQLKKGKDIPGVLTKIDEMKRVGVLNEGWFAADIRDGVIDSVRNNFFKKINPLSRQNIVLKGNKTFGTILENNARIAHYIAMTERGMSPIDAANSVKKYLFDYEDLTKIEKDVLKRIAPFYTWTRKNIPLQLEALIRQPAKFVLPTKVVDEVESHMGDKPNDKWMSDYLKTNIPVRLGQDENGNYKYFLLGNWLPQASAIDFLSQPMDNIINMVTPLLKTPIEQIQNKSLFWKDTLGERSPLESSFKQQGEFLGQSMRNKTINLLRNIRILNDIDRFINKKDPTATKDSIQVKFYNLLFGKSGTYDVDKSQYFYNKDTEDRVKDLKNNIKEALKNKDPEQARKLQEELKSFQKERSK